MNETFEMKETNRRKTNEKNNLVNIKQQEKKSTREIKIELSSQLKTTFLLKKYIYITLLKLTLFFPLYSLPSPKTRSSINASRTNHCHLLNSN